MCDSSKGLMISMNISYTGKKCSAFLKKETKLTVFLVKEKTCTIILKQCN